MNIEEIIPNELIIKNYTYKNKYKENIYNKNKLFTFINIMINRISLSRSKKLFSVFEFSTPNFKLKA